MELTLLDKISVTLHVENCAFESLRFPAQAFRKVTIPLQLKMVTSNKKTCLVNGSNGNHSAVTKNWTIGAKTENLLNETPNGSQNQFPQYVTAH